MFNRVEKPTLKPAIQDGLEAPMDQWPRIRKLPERRYRVLKDGAMFWRTLREWQVAHPDTGEIFRLSILYERQLHSGKTSFRFPEREVFPLRKTAQRQPSIYR